MMAVPKHSENLYHAAKALAERGWLVFPLHTIRAGHCSCGNPSCKNAGKHPRTPHGFKDASCDESLICRWWATGESNIGIATGSASGLLVIDIDYRHGGNDSLTDLERQNGPLPESIEALTGGGGRHIYFNYSGQPAISNSAGILGPGLDVRCENGFVVAPPSLHISGHRYVWEVSHHPDDVALADPPDWLVQSLTKPIIKSNSINRFATWRQLLDSIPVGTRNTTLTSIAGWLRLYHPQQVVEAILQIVNQARCQPPLAETEISDIVRSIFRYPQPGVNGHPKAAVPRYTRNEVDNA
ncbi:MAG: bifunctional DNA primase/polymerase [Chloroflexi bacterium]|nr:bifunctional DNA primase/polymerase [Chloroflexota bacterium]